MKMICPKSETCKEANVCFHASPHEAIAGCVAGVLMDCPACVPVKEVKKEKEKR